MVGHARQRRIRRHGLLCLGHAAGPSAHRPDDPRWIWPKVPVRTAKSTIKTATATATGGYYLLASDRPLLVNPDQVVGDLGQRVVLRAEVADPGDHLAWNG